MSSKKVEISRVTGFCIMALIAVILAALSFFGTPAGGPEMRCGENLDEPCDVRGSLIIMLVITSICLVIGLFLSNRGANKENEA